MTRLKKIIFLLLAALLTASQAYALEPADLLPVFAPRDKTEVTLSLDPADYPYVFTEYTASESEKNDSKAFLIKVNRTENTVTVYKKGADGEYSEAVMAMVCSVGTATPRGTYNTSSKYRWHELFGRCYGQYCTRIVGNILFHSVPYYSMSSADLEYDEYNKLGTTASMGCVRLQAANAQWIYENCASGTKVIIYDDDDPGPLGKPEFTVIDTMSTDRGWDPTDTDENNPWRTQQTGIPSWLGDMPEINGIEK